MNDAALQRIWYGDSKLALLLLPLSWIFFLIIVLRRALYRVGVLRMQRVAKPVIVVGNLTVGGTGKTPAVILLANALRERGFVPGIITRGYGGHSREWPREVSAGSDPIEVGDEAVLLAERSGAIVIAGPDRVRAAQRAVERGATIVISDDGLQHYRLGRDFEIVLIDAVRRFGNSRLLPAGPLRESLARLREVDAILCNCRAQKDCGPIDHSNQFAMRSTIETARSLVSGETRSLRSFAGARVHALAAIGNPNAFFVALRTHGLNLDARALADHARLSSDDLRFDDTAPVLMTEKDAVKCRAFADARCWSVPLQVTIDGQERLLDAILRKLDTPR